MVAEGSELLGFGLLESLVDVVEARAWSEVFQLEAREPGLFRAEDSFLLRLYLVVKLLSQRLVDILARSRYLVRRLSIGEALFCRRES